MRRDQFLSVSTRLCFFFVVLSRKSVFIEQTISPQPVLEVSFEKKLNPFTTPALWIIPGIRLMCCWSFKPPQRLILSEVVVLFTVSVWLKWKRTEDKRELLAQSKSWFEKWVFERLFWLRKFCGEKLESEFDGNSLDPERMLIVTKKDWAKNRIKVGIKVRKILLCKRREKMLTDMAPTASAAGQFYGSQIQTMGISNIAPHIQKAVSISYTVHLKPVSRKSISCRDIWEPRSGSRD